MMAPRLQLSISSGSAGSRRPSQRPGLIALRPGFAFLGQLRSSFTGRVVQGRGDPDDSRDVTSDSGVTIRIHPDVLAAMSKNPTSSDAWAMLSGYVAELVREGSKGAADVLTYMHELKPATRLFTGSVEELQQGETE